MAKVKIVPSINGQTVSECLVDQEVKFKLNKRNSRKNTWKSNGVKYKQKSVKLSFSSSGTQVVKCRVAAKRVKTSINVLELADPNAVTLTYINQTNDANPLNIVTFQKNVATVFDETATAWTVFQLDKITNQTVTFNQILKTGVNDSNKLITAQNGQMYSATNDSTVVHTGAGTSPREIQVFNAHSSNVVAKVFRTGKLLSEKTLATGETAHFEFRPTVFVGIVNNSIIEGQTMDSTVLSSINTELSLLGIKSADVIVTGGGAGPSATPFSFSFANVQY